MGAVKMRVQTTKHHGLPDSLDSDINSLLFQTLFVFAIQRFSKSFFLELYCLFTKFTMKHARLYFTYLSFCIVYVISYVCIKFVIWCYYPTFNCPFWVSQIGQAPTPANHNAHHHPSTNGAHLHVIWTSSTSTIKPHTSLSFLRSGLLRLSQMYTCLPTSCVLSSAVSSDLPCPVSPAISCRFIQVSYWSVWFLPCPRVPVKT